MVVLFKVCFSTNMFKVFLNKPQCKICNVMQQLHQLCANAKLFHLNNGRTFCPALR